MNDAKIKNKKGISRPFVAASKDDTIQEEGDGKERKGLNSLSENFASSSPKGIALGCNSEGPSTSSSVKNTSSAARTGLSSLEGFAEGDRTEKAVIGKVTRGKKVKRVVASTGTVSTMLGKEYMRSNPCKESAKSKRFANERPEKEEQFICSMLQEECGLSMEVVRDVWCKCENNFEKARNVLLDLSTSSYEQSRNGRSCNYSANINEDAHGDNLRDKSSASASHFTASTLRNNIKVPANSEKHAPTSPRSNISNLPQKLLESMYNIPKSSEYDRSTMNWREVAKKMELPRKQSWSCPSGVEETQLNNYAKGNEYQEFREVANEQSASRTSHSQKWRSSLNSSHFSLEYLEQLSLPSCSFLGGLHTRRDQAAAEKGSQDTFKDRNEDIKNVLKIDLHGQRVKHAKEILKRHLFGASISSVHSLEVITGYGLHSGGTSELKNSVIELAEKEGLEWSDEENPGVVVIRLDGPRRFSFLDSDSEVG